MRRSLFTLMVCGFGCASVPDVSMYEQAQQLGRRGKPLEAYEKLATALCQESSGLDAARNYVELWMELGSPGEPLAKVKGCDLEPGMIAYIEGLTAGVARDWPRAGLAFGRALELSSSEDHPEVAYRYGLIELESGELENARVLLDRAAGLEPERADIRLALARVFMAREEYEKAIEAVKGLLVIRAATYDIERARRLLWVAIRKSGTTLPENIEADLRDVLSALEKGDVNKEHLPRLFSLAKELNHPKVMNVAALVALNRGLYVEATQWLERAAQLNPLDPEPLRILGTSRYSDDKLHQALGPLKEAFARNPFDIEIARMLAVTATKLESSELARDTYRTLAVLEPAVPEHRLWIARLERKLERYEAARQAALEGVQLQSESVPILLELASIEVQLALQGPSQAIREANKSEAKKTIQRLLDIAPDHPGALALLSSLERL